MLKTAVVLVIFATISEQFSDFRIPINTVLCSILQNAKCEWKQDWSRAEGVRRELDAGKPPVQFYYFCNGNRTEKCGVWLDENKEPIAGHVGTSDRLIGDTFVIEKMSIQILGRYVKIPEEKESLQRKLNKSQKVQIWFFCERTKDQKKCGYWSDEAKRQQD
ncbi:unnamed protein product [Caenorhabditis sp. 36 PRJEB53466]|nr:unnamed protein product [Caenorhabditis sp. 36 PRJEB53466]